MDLTRNSGLKLLTLNCDIGLELAWMGYVFCISANLGKHLIKV